MTSEPVAGFCSNSEATLLEANWGVVSANVQQALLNSPSVDVKYTRMCQVSVPVDKNRGIRGSGRTQIMLNAYVHLFMNALELNILLHDCILHTAYCMRKHTCTCTCTLKYM